MPGHMVAAIAAEPELGNTAERLGVASNWGVSPRAERMSGLPPIRYL